MATRICHFETDIRGRSDFERYSASRRQKIKLISVTAEHNGADRTGIIILENSVHLETLYHKLTEHIDKPLTEIGDFELDFGPPYRKRGQNKYVLK